MANRTASPEPSIGGILDKIPASRILLVGKSGAGKSSLINSVFNINLSTVSHGAAGRCNINDEVRSSANPYLILHDSEGFEPTKSEHLDVVKDFLRSQNSLPDLKDKVHAIWLCIQTPHAGGRAFETGDEQLIRFATQEIKVPIVVVFTQFDLLISLMMKNLSDKEEDELSDDEIDELCWKRAEEEFEKSCVKPLQAATSKFRPSSAPIIQAKTSTRNGSQGSITELARRYQSSRSKLVDDTQQLVQDHWKGDLWIVFAVAQRASANVNIKSSIEVGMKKYWQSLSSGTAFSSYKLKQCLSVLHKDITACWNFNDPDNLLSSDDFQEQVMKLVQLVTPDDSETANWFNQDLDGVKALIGLVSTVASAAVPAVAGISLSLLFVKWISDVYQRTPETLRCLVGYIVDLTLVMDQLFLNTLPVSRPFKLTKEQIDDALEGYKSVGASSVHGEIRTYASKLTIASIIKSNNAQQKTIELIEKYKVCRF